MIDTERRLQILEECGFAWVIRWLGDKTLAEIDQRLENVRSAMQAQVISGIPDVDPFFLHQERPEDAKAFFQIFLNAGTPEVFLVAWLLLHGGEIDDFLVEYEKEKAFSLRISVVLPGGQVIRVQSHNIFDLPLLRHLGLATVSEHPVITGIYALKLDMSSQ